MTRKQNFYIFYIDKEHNHQVLYIMNCRHPQKTIRYKNTRLIEYYTHRREVGYTSDANDPLLIIPANVKTYYH